MAFINIRNKFHIHWGKIALTLILGLTFSVSQAQIESSHNLPNYDDKFMHYGFLLAINTTQFKVVHSDDFVKSDTITNLYPQMKPGFTLGFVVNTRISEFVDFRIMPEVAFYERSMVFNIKGVDEDVSAVFNTAVVELPLLIKYKSRRRLNHRIYMIGGVKFAFEVGKKKDSVKKEELLTKATDISLEYGIGWDRYLPLFKFAPEIRVSYGLTNLFIPQDNIFSNKIKKLSTFTVTASFLFE
jgi:hypothetical protein